MTMQSKLYNVMGVSVVGVTEALSALAAPAMYDVVQPQADTKKHTIGDPDPVMTML